MIWCAIEFEVLGWGGGIHARYNVHQLEMQAWILRAILARRMDLRCVISLSGTESKEKDEIAQREYRESTCLRTIILTQI